MTKFKLVISPSVYRDIRDAVKWYNSQQKDLGAKFYAQLTTELQLLKKNPHFQIRYFSVRCLPVRNFPFLIHFKVNDTEHIIYIEAILHTSRNPESWPEK